MSGEQLTLPGAELRYRVVPVRDISGQSWGAKCETCGRWLTKWDYTRAVAARSAAHELDRRDGRQHRCA